MLGAYASPVTQYSWSAPAQTIARSCPLSVAISSAVSPLRPYWTPARKTMAPKYWIEKASLHLIFQARCTRRWCALKEEGTRCCLLTSAPRVLKSRSTFTHETRSGAEIGVTGNISMLMYPQDVNALLEQTIGCIQAPICIVPANIVAKNDGTYFGRP